ncbi:MAG TPA: peptidylprolyl isomerase [Anaerolineales bacterium]|nr:peptidylprolyl isomerase [Anaerolineales bacterium]
MFSQRSFIRILLTLFFALGLSACASFFPPEPTVTPTATLTPEPPTATPEPMVLTVNGEGITVVEFNAEVQRYLTAQTSLGKTISAEEAVETVTEDLTAQLLLAEAARENGFLLDEEGLKARVDSLIAQVGGVEALSAWQSEHGYSEAAFRSALKRSAEAAWMRDKILAEVPSTAEQVHVQQILLYNQDTALSFLTQLNGGANFDELALRADPLTRGDLGWVPRGYLLEPKIEEAAFSLAPGTYSDVIATEVGFHIVRVLERDPQRPLSPDAYLSLQDLALKNWVAEQRQQANIIFVQQPP